MWQIAGELEEARKVRDAADAKKAATPVAVLNTRLEGEHNLCELMLFIPCKGALGATPGFTEVKIRGPRRCLRAEAVKDGFELRNSFHEAGEVEVRKRLKELRGKTWTKEELPYDTAKIEEPADLEQRLRLAQRPAGTGWSRRKDQEFFVHNLAPMAYDPKKRQYFETEGGVAVRPCPPPHDPTEYPISVSAGASLVGRDDADLTAPERPRTLLLKELVKTGAAMKKPLFFLDEPASCFALFEGVRGTAAVDWVSKNFHTKLLSKMGQSLQYWSDSKIEGLLSSIFEELDEELLQKPATCYDGVSLAIALFLGDRLTVATLGAVRGLWLTSTAEPRILGDKHWVTEEGTERVRVDEACAEVLQGAALASADGGSRLLLQRPVQPRQTAVEEQGPRAEIMRVLSSAPDSFATLGFGSEDVIDSKAPRSLYKKLALRVHPDKAPEDLKAQAKEAFAKVETAAETIETLYDTNAAATEKLHQILATAGSISSSVMPQSWARSLLGIEDTAEREEAEKKAKELKKELGKLGLFADGRLGQPDAARAGRLIDDALEVLGAPRPSKEGESLAAVEVTRALGLRDLKKPRPIVLAKPHIDTVQLEGEGAHHLVLLSRSTTALKDADIIAKVRYFARQPKAASLTIAQEVAAHHVKNDAARAQCLAGAVVGLFQVGADQAEEPPAKKARVEKKSQAAEQGDKIRCCHILLKHKDLRMVQDPESQQRLKRKGPMTRTVVQAERELLEMQKQLLANPNIFHVLCRKHSECDTAIQPGQSAGDLGWVARGGGGLIEAAMFSLRVHEISDIVSTPRGLHIIQRIA